MSVQSMMALERANQVRLGRADLKRQIKTGELDPRDVLREVPELLRPVGVYDFLVTCPRVGHQKANSLLRDVGRGHFLNPTLPLGRLSQRTRLALAAGLPVTAAMRRAA